MVGSIINRSYFNSIFCLVFIGVILSGCNREQSVVRYKIPKERSGIEHLRDADQLQQSPAKARESAELDRMVVALAMREDSTWFFKLNGPVSRIDETEKEWLLFLKSVSFDDRGKPVWTLPDGWSDGGSKPMRFATLLVDSKKPPVELAISSLSAGQDLLLNVNRWRGQLGLEPVVKGNLEEQLKKIEAGEEELMLFDATGKMSGGMMPPFARSGGGGGPAMSTGAAASSGSGIEFTAPEGWEAGKPSPFLKAKFTRTDGDKSAQITVSSLTAANRWLPNATRWAGQVGMGSLTKNDIDERTESITVDGQEGKLIRLIPEGEGLDKATIATMVKKSSQAWFFKLTGDRKVVSESDEEFNRFLKSIKFP